VSAVADPTTSPTAAITDVGTYVDLTLDNSGQAYPVAAEVSLSGADAANFSLPVDTLLEIASGGSGTIRVSRSAAGASVGSNCSVDFLMSSGVTTSVTVTAAEPPPSVNKWLEVRIQFDQFSTQASDATMIELRSGIVGSFGGASAQPGPDQTTGVPIAPIAAGIYPDYVAYASLTTTNIYPDVALSTPPTNIPGPAMMTAPLANAYWSELPAGSTQNESVLTAVGPLDVIAFFGPLAPGPGYSLSMYENLSSFTSFLDDPNVTVHVRVWDQDPTAGAAPLWPSGSPPANQGSTPVAGIAYPGTAPYIDDIAGPGTSVPTFTSSGGLPGNASGPVTNGWSLWALTCDYGGGSGFTHDGATLIAGGSPRIYHVDDVQAGSTFGGGGGATHPGINGTFEIL